MATTTTHNKYGVPLSIQVQENNASKYKKRKGLAYPLAAELGKTVTGGFLKKTTSQDSYFKTSYGIALIKNNLRQLLLTEKGERVMLPDYGLSLRKYLFEPLDETIFRLIRGDVSRTLKKYFSMARILKLSVFSTASDAERHQLIVSLTLQLLDESLDIFDVEAKLG